MTYRRYGLSLLAVAIGVMAFAPSAQAALGYSFNKTSALHATFDGKQFGINTLLVAALNLEIRCEKLSIQGGLITSGTHAEGKLLFEVCNPFTLTLVPYSKCHVYISAIDKKLHITATALFLPAEILTTNAPAILLEKITGSVLIESTDPMNPECTLPEHATLKGELCTVIDNNQTVEPLILYSNTIQGTCKPRNVLEGTEQSSGGTKDQLLYGNQIANIDGAAHLLLTGAHAGMTLGVSL